MLIDSYTVKKNIKTCEDLFENAKDVFQKQLILKLSLLEASGWIEKTLDKLYLSDPNIPTDKKTTLFKNISKINSFKGEDVFKTLSQIHGLIITSKLESKNKKKTTQFYNALDILSLKRNNLAHTHSEENDQLMGFSVMKQHLKAVRFGITFLYKELHYYYLNNKQK